MDSLSQFFFPLGVSKEHPRKVWFLWISSKFILFAWGRRYLVVTFHNQMDRPLDTFLGDMMADDTLPISASCMATENDLLMFTRKYLDLQMVGFSQLKKIHGLVLQSMCWEEWHWKGIFLPNGGETHCLESRLNQGVVIVHNFPSRFQFVFMGFCQAKNRKLTDVGPYHQGALSKPKSLGRPFRLRARARLAGCIVGSCAKSETFEPYFRVEQLTDQDLGISRLFVLFFFNRCITTVSSGLWWYVMLMGEILIGIILHKRIYATIATQSFPKCCLFCIFEYVVCFTKYVWDIIHNYI